MAKHYVYLTRRIGTKGDAAKDVAAIDQSAVTYAEASIVAGNHQHEILNGLFDGQNLFEVIQNMAKPTVEEAKKAYLDAVARYRADVDPTDEEFSAAEERLSNLREEEIFRYRRDPSGKDALDHEEHVLNYIDEHRGGEEEAASA